MPAYLISHAETRRGDMLIEDEHLALTIQDGWAILTDLHGVVLALPAEQVACITRVDAEQEQEPADGELADTEAALTK